MGWLCGSYSHMDVSHSIFLRDLKKKRNDYDDTHDEGGDRNCIPQDVTDKSKRLEVRMGRTQGKMHAQTHVIPKQDHWVS